MSQSCFFSFPYLNGRDLVLHSGTPVDASWHQALINTSSYTDEGLLALAYRAPHPVLKKWAWTVVLERILNNSQDFDQKIFCEAFDVVLETCPELKNSVINNISCFFIKLLTKIDLNHSDFTKNFNILVHLTRSNIDLTQIKSLIKLKFCSELFKTCQNLENFEDLNKLLLLSSKLKLLNLFLERETNLLISAMLDKMLKHLILSQINNPATSSELDSTKIIESVSLIKTFDPITSPNQLKIEEIESFLNYQVPAFLPPPEPEKAGPSESSLPELHSVVWRPDAVYKRSLNDFKVSVFLGVLANGDLVAKKTYKFSSAEKYEKSIQNEILTLEKLSRHSSPSNCFLKFYGCQHKPGLIEIFMEAHEKTLTRFIEDHAGHSISRETVKSFISKLLEFFSVLQTLGIFHRDIKPSNILVTQKGNLKVIDFGTASKIDQSDITVQHDVQGTKNYMAPELFDVDGTCLKSGKYRPEKSDVYSLGVTFFEMIRGELVSSLPGGSEVFRRDFRRFVNILNADLNVKMLLIRMLEPDYTLRPDFKDCLELLSEDETNLN